MYQKYFKESKDGLVLHVKVVPNSSKNEIIETDEFLKVKLTAPPVDGKANKCLTEFLAKTFCVPKTSILVVKGQTSKEKTLLFRKIPCAHAKNNV